MLSTCLSVITRILSCLLPTLFIFMMVEENNTNSKLERNTSWI